MKIAYFDCVSGISGNMTLGAMLDAGLEIEELRRELTKLGLSGYELEARKVTRQGISATLVDVQVMEEGVERHLSDIEAILEASALDDEVKEASRKAFARLAAAEAKIHRTSVENIHFHEVGGLDAIVDIVGAFVGLRCLGVQKVYASPLPLGRGTVECAHGTLPLPAPATLELLQAVPVYGRDVEAELVTPTGATIITSLTEDFGPLPPMRTESVGYGAGHRDLPLPNVLRLIIGSTAKPQSVRCGGYQQEKAVMIEANIDDMNPEFYDHVMGRLFALGAMDVFLTPIHMKKNRPAVTLSALLGQELVNEALAVIFEETTTLGTRLYQVDRRKLSREQVMVETAYGQVAVKIGRAGGEIVNISPEYEDCRRIAERQGIPLKMVYDEVKKAASSKQVGMGMSGS